MSTSPPVQARTDELLMAVGVGDRAAFAALYDATVGLVYGNVVRVLGDAPRSGEVTREVFVAVWRDAARFDPAWGDARTWLLTAAHRHAVQRARDDDAAGDGSRGGTSRVGALPALIGGEPQLDAALADLGPVQRRSVELAYYGGYTYREIAELLDERAEPVSRHLRAGLLRLGEVLRGRPLS